MLQISPKNVTKLLKTNLLVLCFSKKVSCPCNITQCGSPRTIKVNKSKNHTFFAFALSAIVHYVSACGIRPKTQFWLFQHFRHSEGALVCKTKVPSWIFDFHQFSGAHWGGWSEPIRDLFVTFLKMCAISIISVWRPNMVSLWSFIVSTSPSVNNFSYLWQNIQILSQTLTKT